MLPYAFPDSTSKGRTGRVQSPWSFTHVAANIYFFACLVHGAFADVLPSIHLK